MTTSPAELKRAVCSGLTGVVRDSDLRDVIDPKAFFMMLNTNFAALVRGESIDLTLLWEPLRARHPEAQLLPLFVRFEDVAGKLGLLAQLPEPVAALSEGDRQACLNRVPTIPSPRRVSVPPSDDLMRPSSPPAPIRGPDVLLDSDGLQLVPISDAVPMGAGPDGIDLASTSPEALIPLPLEAMTPLPTVEFEPTPLPDSAFGGANSELKRRMTTALVTFLKSTPAGPHLQGAQISFFVAARFESLFDGRSFFFPVIREAIGGLEGVREEDMYLGAARFRRWLARYGIELVEPEWKLSPETKAQLDGMSHGFTHEAFARPEAQPEAKKEEGPSPGQERRADRLERYGLGVLSAQKKRLLKYLGYVMLFLIGALGILIVRPIRQGDAGDYRAALPITEVRWVEQKFMGTLDVDAWFKLPDVKRQEALKKLTEQLQREGKLRGASIIHPKTRTAVIWDAAGKELQTSPSMLGATDPFTNWKPPVRK